MVELPKNRPLDLQAKIKQQRNTIEALKRDGHEFTDAERHLKELQGELRLIEAGNTREPQDVPGSGATSS